MAKKTSTTKPSKSTKDPASVPTKGTAPKQKATKIKKPSRRSK